MSESLSHPASPRPREAARPLEGRTPESRPDPRRVLGAAGEAAVAAWYEEHGYRILARNWRCREGELDLIVAHGREFVFCEVKTRRTDTFGLPEEAVTRQKQMRIRRLAARWLDDEAPTRPRAIRFDVATVRHGVVEVLEGAF
ncbi:MAG: YraN family protein [Acidimicrobiales bacterium]